MNGFACLILNYLDVQNYEVDFAVTVVHYNIKCLS